MEKEEKKSTATIKPVNNYKFEDTLEAFKQMDSIRKSKSISVAEIALKLGLQKSAYYRYCSEYGSQKIPRPSIAIVRKYANLFGYKSCIYLSKIVLKKK